MNDEQLDIKLRATLTESISQFDRLTSSALNFDKVITTTIKKTDSLGNLTGFTQSIKSLDGAISKVSKFDAEGNLVSETLKQTNKEANLLKNGLQTVFDFNKLYLYWNLTKRIRDILKSIITSSIDYIETENKFNMSMGDSKDNATRFVNRMTEAIGIAKTELMDYQSTYKNILSGLGDFTHQESEKISESLVKMALDYSSLFNVDTDESMEKFQSALVGSIRPIRSDSGYDVSDTTIGAKAKELGVDRSVGQLNQMEKRILRIIVLMEQLKNTGAMGDLARTIESPSNQLKVLQAQIQEVGVWLGNVFIGTLGQVLPYINGFVMVIKELIKMFAFFVGYKADTSNLSDVFESANDSVSGISSGLDDANKNAKELRKALMGWDVLNVIYTPTNNNSSENSGVGSIDPAILNALSEYDSLMENVRMKATDIRDKIMEWLGFIKKINPLTGEISWELQDGYTNFEKILDIAKSVGLAIGAWKISSAAATLFSTITGFDKDSSLRIATGITLVITGTYMEYNGISHLIDDGMDLFALLETVVGAGMIGGGFYTILDALAKNGVISSKINKLTLSTALTLLVTAFNIGKKAIETGNIEYMLLSAVLAGGGAALGLMALGAGTGIVISAAVVISIGTFLFEWASSSAQGIKELKEEIKDLSKEVEDSINSYENLINTKKLNAESQLLELEYADEMRKKLDAIVDSNGKIKEGYEDRADFILGELNEALETEYVRNGEIIENYQEMQNEIKNIVAEKKKEIQLEAYQEVYKESIKQQITLEKQQNELQEKRTELLKEHNRIVSEEPWNVVAMYEYNKAWEENEEAIKNVDIALEECSTSVSFYSEQIDGLTAGVIESSGEIITNVSEMTTTATEEMKELANTNVEEFVTKLNSMNEELQSVMLAQCTTIDNYSGEIEEKWKELATNSADEFSNAIALVDDNTAFTILKSLDTLGIYTPEVENAWLNLATTSKDKYENELKNVDVYTEAKILAAKTKVEGLTEDNVKAWSDLSNRSEEAYETGIADIDHITLEEMNEAIKNIEIKTPEMGNASSNAGNTVNSSFSNVLDGAGTVSKWTFSIISALSGNFFPLVSNTISTIGSQLKGVWDSALGNFSTSFSVNANGGGSVGARANGGPVSVGEMFIAREAGPELVGKIGNTTSVMNNQQIVQSVSSGVATAVEKVLSNYSFNQPIALTVPVQIGTTKIQEESYLLNERENNIRGR